MNFNLTKEKGNPITTYALDVTFPVMTSLKNQTPGSLWGTAFPINKTTFITAKHVAENAAQHVQDKQADFIVLGQPVAKEIGAKIKLTAVIKYELHDNLDVAILQITPDQFSDIEISPWIFNTLPLLSDVATLGFPYSLDLQEQTIVSRGLKGYVSGNGPQKHIGFPFMSYELSFQSPRGLSGAPLWTDEVDKKIVGMIIGNASNEMEIVTEKEVLDNGKVIESYTKIEVLHMGIAIQSSELKDLHFELLGGSLLEFLQA